MTIVSGPLVNVTTSASSVRDVQVHTKKVRTWGDGLMTPDPSQATLSNGAVEFEAAPGPVVMVLFMAEAGAETVSLVVGEGATQSLADAYRDGQMASDRDASELAGILEQIRESVGASVEARAGAEAAAADAAGSAEAAGRDADRAETAAGEAATEAAGLAADAVRLEVKGDADRSAAGATTATEKAAEAAGSATRAEEAEAGAVEAEEGAEAGQELSEDAAAVAVAATAAFEGHSPQQVIDAADRAEAASERVGTVAQIETWVGDVQEAADRVGSAEQVGAWVEEATTLRGDTVEAADRAQTQAGVATGQVGFARAAAGAAAEDARRAEAAREGAETIQQEIPAKIGQELETKLPSELDTRVPDELNKHLPGELDERVPPMVADALAEDRAVADAAAAAAGPAVDAAANAIIWPRGDLGSTNLDTVTANGLYPQSYYLNATPERGYPAMKRGHLTVLNLGGIVKQEYLSTSDGLRWQRERINGVWGTWGFGETFGIQNIGTGHLDSITASGIYVQPYYNHATPERGYPAMKRGHLTVQNLGANIVHHEYTSSSDGLKWRREFVNGAWSTWSEWPKIELPEIPDGSDTLLEERARTISNGTDWDTLTAPGQYRRSFPASTDTNSPNMTIGVLTVYDPGHASGNVAQLFASPASGLFYRGKSLSGWSSWVQLSSGTSVNPPADETTSPAVDEGSARREFLVSDLMDRKGGTIGTSGKAAITFRFDHHTDQFRRLILPLLEEWGIPWSQALNSRTQGVGNNTMTWAEIQDSAISTGGEVFNHGATHGDAQTREKLEDEIVNSLSELRGHLPLLPIDGWMQPGTGGSFGGLQPFRTEANWTTEAGRLLTAYHPIVYGYKAGLMKPLDGRPSIGQNHLSMDTMSAAAVKTEIDRAVSTRSGVVLMIHPNFLEDTTGAYMSLAGFTEVVEYVAELRSSGKVEIMSASGLQLCDSTHSQRRHLIDMNLATTTLAGQRLANRFTFAADGAHELHGTIQAVGDVKVDVFTPDRVLDYTRTLTISGEREVWLPFTIPVSASDLSVRVTGATGGLVHVRAI